MYIYAYYLLTTLSNWAMHHKQIEFLKCYIARIIPHLMIYQQCKMHSRVYIVYTTTVHPLVLCTTLYLSLCYSSYVLCIHLWWQAGTWIFSVETIHLQKNLYLLCQAQHYKFFSISLCGPFPFKLKIFCKVDHTVH